ncbi:MAG: DnaA N-terminal domain-containing protein [Gemmobacter sp.]
MERARPVGRNAAVRKYDLLTALGAHACRGDKHLQRLVLRFVTLIVARYNWQTDEISVGQREIAQLWAVDERTVKRELARLRALGWLVQKRCGARGRVAVHGLDLAAIRAATAPDWAAVGPDFVQRMQGGPEPAAPAGNVVPFPAAAAAPLSEGAGLWHRAQARLQAADPALFAAWFRGLSEVLCAGGTLELAAAGAFQAQYIRTHYLSRILAAVRSEDATIREVRIADV